MIAIQSESGEFIKTINNLVESDFGFHKSFGLISREKAEKRTHTKKRQYYDFSKDEWLCSFKIQSKENNFNLSSFVGCQASFENNKWKLQTPMGVFYLSNVSVAEVIPVSIEVNDENKWINKAIVIALFGVLFSIPFLFVSTSKVEKPEEVIQPITVKLQKKIETVKVKNTLTTSVTEVKTTKSVLTKSQSQQAVKRNLGFLGIVGSKDLSKVVGGVPQNLKAATAGAGAGGDAGSGGEVLTGLGKGLRKTTVGNTGVQGLGGVGTKGAGGGLGGYGNTLVASGGGNGIAGVAVSNSEIVLEGGLSKYAINATIAKYLNQIRRCYEAELKNNPELQGLVEMSFEINPNGKLNYANVQRTTLNNTAVEGCMSTKMMDWQFPLPKGGVNVKANYPFMLRPVGM